MKNFFAFLLFVALLCGATMTLGQNIDDLLAEPPAQGEMREPTPPAQTVKATEVAETVEKKGNGSAAASAKAEAKVVNTTHVHPTRVVYRNLPAAKPATTRPSGQGGAMPQNINVNVSLPPQVAGTAQGGTLPADPALAGVGPVDPHTAFPGRMSYAKGKDGSVWLRTEPAGGDWGWLPWVVAIAAVGAVLWALAQANAARDRAARAEEEARRAQAAARPQAQRRPAQ